MLKLALATSNAPALYRPRSAWQTVYDAWTNPEVPPPNELEGETDEVVDGYIERIKAAQKTMRDKLVAAKPDVILMIGYDDGVAFSNVQVPQFCTFVGEDLTGSASIPELGEKPEDNRVTLKNDTDFAWELQRSLVDEEIDVNYMGVQNPMGKPEWGTSSAFTLPAANLLAGLDIPVTPFFINCTLEPTLPGRRIYAFGQKLGKVLAGMDQNVAILAVGGLSHDPRGARAGWIDDRLDRWVLNCFKKGDTQRLKTLFDLDSDTLSGGTGQIRTWLAAAAAAESQGGKAAIIDYIPALRAMTGLGFAAWDFA
ncbi:hypothetical protein [Phenylobacterium immobile]|uniref:DODA-type extradiol aromatic ring-opening family dioxygenase n=1 Tax=Phenylobacterium immobile TaxID=21 RepID=UPI000ADAEBB6|nr:hypothetical protein [Phenylobacterium immobile]